MAKTKTKKQDDTLVEFRVAMTSTCTHKGLVFHYTRPRQTCADGRRDIRLPLPNWSFPLVPFHQSCIYILHGQKKHSGVADQLTLASGGSEHA